MPDEADKKKAAEVIQNAMTSRPSPDEKLSPEDAILLRMQKAMRDIQRPSYPSKRRERKVTRSETKGNQAARKLTKSFVRNVYTTTEEAQKTFINVIPIISTREVGPGDQYNSDKSCHGKETNSR